MITYIRAQLDGLIRIVRGILDFIGDLWSRIYKYVGSFIKRIYRDIVRYAELAYTKAYAYVNKMVGKVAKDIGRIYGRARQFAISLISSAVITAKNFAKSLFNSISNTVRSGIALINAVKSWAQGQISAILGNVSGIWRWISNTGNAVYNIVRNWLKVFTADNLSRFVYLVTNLFPSIFNFFKEPITHITLWLEPMLLDMLFWLLAYEMGTKEGSLPNKPKRYGD